MAARECRSVYCAQSKARHTVTWEIAYLLGVHCIALHCIALHCIALHSQVHNSTMTVAEFKPIFYWEYSHRMWGKWELPGFRVSGSLRVQGQRDPTAIPTRCDCFLRMSSFSTAAVPKCVAPCGAALHHAALRCTMRRCVAPCGAVLQHVFSHKPAML
jgi:hypothetical protein